MGASITNGCKKILVAQSSQIETKAKGCWVVLGELGGTQIIKLKTEIKDLELQEVSRGLKGF